jgi:hypothetical protein
MHAFRAAVSLATVAATVFLTTSVASAHAQADNAALAVSLRADGNFTYADYYESGHLIGWGLWSKDPAEGEPGDSLRATDDYQDGKGIVAHLSTGRTASTAGHTYPYTTEWVHGDLPENHTYYIWACTVKAGDEGPCTDPIKVSS